jgi:hypothetical protein
MLNLEHPAERSRIAVKDWFEGNTPCEAQFLIGTGLNTIFDPYHNLASASTDSVPTGSKPADFDSNDLVTLRPIASDDPVSKAIANSKWLFKYGRVCCPK